MPDEKPQPLAPPQDALPAIDSELAEADTTAASAVVCGTKITVMRSAA